MLKKRILLVDDEIELVKLVQARLQHSGYEILTAYEGAECLKLAEEEKIDLILLDILMPKMDGYETLRRIRSNPKTAKIPVIMLTAKSQMEDVARAIGLGAQEYIVKPFDYKTMLEKIKKAIIDSSNKK